MSTSRLTIFQRVLSLPYCVFYFTQLFYWFTVFWIFTRSSVLFKLDRNISKSDIDSSCVSVCQRGTTWLPLEEFSWNLVSLYEDFLETLSRKFKIYYNLTRITDTSDEDVFSFVISCLFISGVRNVSDKFLVKIKPHILCSINFFPVNHAVYEIMWENNVQPDMSLIIV
jgi:hypothetical protein